MTGVRFVRALWPIIFLVPLTRWADRGCAVAGVDPLYHATLWVHARLGWFVVSLALVSATIVVAKIAVARQRLARLYALAEPLPNRLSDALMRATQQARIKAPDVVYLELSTPLATTVMGPTILVSRGFIDPLDDTELALVVKHEIAHVRYHDAAAGALWHLFFAALLIPGFEPLERRLHAVREQRANVAAARDQEDRYVSLVRRLARGPSICADAICRISSLTIADRATTPLCVFKFPKRPE